MLTVRQWSIRGLIDSMRRSGFEDETAFTPSYGHQAGREKHPGRRTYQQLQEQNDQQARLILKLRSDVEEEVQKVQKFRQLADGMAYSLENRELTFARQYSDDDIYSRFRSLVLQINTWSVYFAEVRQNGRDYSAEAIEEFRRVSPGISDFQCFLQTPKNLRRLVRGCVGLAITESIFRTISYDSDSGPYGEDVWMDKELAHGFVSIDNSLFRSGKSSHVCDYVAINSDPSRPKCHLPSGFSRLESSYSDVDIET